MPRRLHNRPILAALTGAVAISFSGILFRVAHVSPSTGAVFRCLYAVPPLWLLARWEDRRYGPRPLKQRALAWGAGLFFAVDLVAWHQGIEEVGAGLATVLGNLQVVLVGLLAWAILRERPSGRSLAAIPVALVGVVLISGAFENGAYGRNPGLGVAYGILTAASYAGFLLVLRAGNRDLRRPAGPLFDATLVAGLTAIPTGLVIGNLDWTPGWTAQGYLLLLALSSQVLGWLLISITLPRLPAALTSVLLTFQPVLSVLFAWAILEESPSALQLVGVAAIVSGLLIVSTGRRRPREPAYAVGVAELAE
ncbi:MAG: DMT family transporter [Actinomycetota bacterium]|nr:DMT family transporter [Actinomycetota bacterium]